MLQKTNHLHTLNVTVVLDGSTEKYDALGFAAEIYHSLELAIVKKGGMFESNLKGKRGQNFLLTKRPFRFIEIYKRSPDYEKPKFQLFGLDVNSGEILGYTDGYYL